MIDSLQNEQLLDGNIHMRSLKHSEQLILSRHIIIMLLRSLSIFIQPIMRSRVQIYRYARFKIICDPLRGIIRQLQKNKIF